MVSGSKQDESGNGSSPMSLAMTLGERFCWLSSLALLSHRLAAVRTGAAVRISLGWRLPLASVVALLSSDSRGASLLNFHEHLVPSFSSKIGSGRGDLGGSSGDGGCFDLSGLGFPGLDFSDSDDVVSSI